MSKKALVIVESPAKAKTINQYLGDEYIVRASYGHVRDLPKSKLGVDVEHDYKPEYVVPSKAKSVIAELKKLADNASAIYLATDFDREGEAIAWHIVELLKPKVPTKRITFHEVTKTALKHAIENPREILINLVDAQQARRVLDRLVGYKLSPLLWRKIYRGLSAGRVQSVAVRLIVEREEEVTAFKSEQYFTIEGVAKVAKGEFKVYLTDKDKESPRELADKKEVDKITAGIKKGDFKIAAIKKDQTQVRPSFPLITSTLQQTAAQKLSFSAKRTMMVAQKLYEGVDLGKLGTVGLITYMRTDSHEISKDAQNAINDFVTKNFGAKYLPTTPNVVAKKVKGAQEAHEAIHPTNFELTPAMLADKLPREQLKLYELIYNQTVASQMTPAEVEVTTAKVSDGTIDLVGKGKKLTFDGHLKLAQKEEYIALPDIAESEKAQIKTIDPIEHWTQPPARYSDASLIKELEKRGIGRPSTYASILSTIVDRGYATKEAGRYRPEAVAAIVITLLKENFPDIVDYDFTAKLEEELDDVAEGDKKYVEVLAEFYEPFSKLLAEKEKSIDRSDLVSEKTDKPCPKCSKMLNKLLNRFGQYYKCEECGFTEPILDGVLPEDAQKQVEAELKIPCEKCGGEMVSKIGRFGPFIACSKYPECKFTKPISIKAAIKCPDCGGDIVRKPTRRGRVFWGCGNYPKCKKAWWDEPTEQKCPTCHDYLVKKAKTLYCPVCKVNVTEEPVTK